jgi:ribonuclease HI
MLKLAKVF